MRPLAAGRNPEFMYVENHHNSFEQIVTYNSRPCDSATFSTNAAATVIALLFPYGTQMRNRSNASFTYCACAANWIDYGNAGLLITDKLQPVCNKVL
jgi:hypothetical protein